MHNFMNGVFVLEASINNRIAGGPSTPDNKVQQAIKLDESVKYTLNEITELIGASKPTLYRKLAKRNSATEPSK